VRRGVVGDLGRAPASAAAADSVCVEDEDALMYSPSRSFLRVRIRSACVPSSSEIASAACSMPHMTQHGASVREARRR
jgi:hypothetical protein